MAAHASGKSFVSHRQLNKLSTRPYSAHELQFDGRSDIMTSDLRPKGSRSVHSSSVDYGSGLSNRLQMSLHESLSEGSLPRYNFSLDDSATIPFGLLYELSEVLNQLERQTLNQLALLLGLTQEQFNRLYHSTDNPAISVITQGERYLKNLSHLQQAFVILKLDNAIALIEKHHSQIRNKIDAEISNKSEDVDVDREDDRSCIFSWNSSNSEQLSSSVNFDNIYLDSHKNTMTRTPSSNSDQSDSEYTHQKPVDKEPQGVAENKTVKQLSSAELLLGPVDSGFGSAEVSPLFYLPSDELDSRVLSVNESLCACDYFDEEGGVLFIPGSSIYLRIPPGALTSGYQIQLSAFMDPAEHGCPRPDDSPRITPLVRCQPDGITFQVPVELVIPHCGVIVEPAKVPVEVYTRPHPDKEGLKPSWVRDDDASSRASLEKTSCSIFLTHFSDYDVVVRDNDCIIGKMLRVFPMINRLSGPADDLLLSLWICNNQQEVYDKLIQEQTGDHGGKVLDSYRSFMLLVSNKAVNISYTNFSNQWKVVTAEETIGYHLLWHGSRGVANLRMKSNTESGGGKLSGTLRVQQEENSESVKFELQKEITDFLKLEEVRSQPVEKPLAQSMQNTHKRDSEGTEEKQRALKYNGSEFHIPPSNGNASHIHVHLPPSSPSRYSDNEMSPASPPTFHVMESVAIGLSNMLDTEDTFCNNWEGLAGKLHYTHQDTQLFAKAKHHTKQVLLSACRSGRLKSYDELISHLEGIERKDAAAYVRMCLSEGSRYLTQPNAYDASDFGKLKPSRQISAPFDISTDYSEEDAGRDETDLSSLPVRLPHGNETRLLTRGYSVQPSSHAGHSTPMRANLVSSDSHQSPDLPVHPLISPCSGKGDSGFSSPVNFVNKAQTKSKPRRKLKLAVNFTKGDGISRRHPSSSSSTSSLSSSTPSSSSLIDFPDSPSTRPKSILSQNSSDDSGFLTS